MFFIYQKAVQIFILFLYMKLYYENSNKKRIRKKKNIYIHFIKSKGNS